MNGFLSIDDLTRADIERLLSSAAAPPSPTRHAGRAIALAFYSASLRTRVGFEAAAARLGVSTTSVLEPRHTAVMSEPESLEDAVQSIAGWFDVVLVRTTERGVPAALAQRVDVPIVNCGDGDGEHPTQALVDLRSIADDFGEIDGRTVVIVGDLHGMRTAHSLVLALSKFEGVRLRCVAPAGLELPAALVELAQRRGVAVEQQRTLEVGDADILYAAGLPLHTAIGELRGAARTPFLIDRDVVERMPAAARILCPLPRIDEIDAEVDVTPQAGYFAQSRRGLGARCAVLDAVLESAAQRQA